MMLGRLSHRADFETWIGDEVTVTFTAEWAPRPWTAMSTRAGTDCVGYAIRAATDEDEELTLIDVPFAPCATPSMPCNTELGGDEADREHLLPPAAAGHPYSLQ